MKKKPKIETGCLSSELLILPDGRILVQNLTQPMAGLLRDLNPKDKTIAPRAGGENVVNVGQASRLSPFSEHQKIRDRQDACPTKQ